MRQAILLFLLAAAALSGCNYPTPPPPPIDQVTSTQTQGAAITHTPITPSPGPALATPTDSPTPPAQPAPPTATVQPSATTAPQATDTTSPPPPENNGPLAVTEKTIQEDTDTPPAMINVAYPQFSDASGSPVAGLTQQIENTVNVPLSYFRGSILTITPPPDFTGKNGLVIKYEIPQNSSRFVSVYFTISEYYMGAAHPSPSSITVNYDLARGRVLQLGDLFKPGADYLTVLSQKSIADLKRQDVLDWDTGAQPLMENFKSWNLSPEGLVITFDPYMVSAYARGYQKVVIPWSELQDILNPELGFGG